MKQQYFELARISAISDGVFAIAMTLLVLNIDVPSVGKNISSAAFQQALMENLPSFLAWIISMTILCRLWATQHALLHAGKKRSRTFMWLNFVFLGTIAFIPFPTALISEYYDQALSVFVFSGSYAMTSFALGGMCILLYKEEGREQYIRHGIHSITYFIVMLPIFAVVSSLLALLLSPKIGIAVWILAPFLHNSIIHVRKQAFKG